MNADTQVVRFAVVYEVELPESAHEGAGFPRPTGLGGQLSQRRRVLDPQRGTMKLGNMLFAKIGESAGYGLP